jgi:glutamate-1-semialdehyde 2,1-aminomutase
MPRNLSEKAYKEAVQYIPGGVNSPVRALRSVGAAPIFVKKANKAMFTDLDNNQYIDFCLSWGVFILGHNHPKIRRTVQKAIGLGTSYGIPTLQETQLAKKIVEWVPSLEKVRFVNSGTEAVMSAVRVARGFTGRNMLVKFDGCYHGHADHLLVAAGSGAASLPESSSSGVPKGFTQYTLSIPYNDSDALHATFSKYGDDIAAVIIEPVAANMGVVLPQDNFLKRLQEVCKKYGALLIFDEVITGFRLAPGGAQQRFDIKPDLSTFGKIVGGGFPAAAFGGRAEIMDLLAPDGPVYQAGTLSGNPIAMVAGIQSLELLGQPDFYSDLENKSQAFLSELRPLIQHKGITLNSYGSMFTLFFTEHEVTHFEDVKKADTQRFATFYLKMLKQGIYFSPSQFEANFISQSHSERQLEITLNAIRKALD